MVEAPSSPRSISAHISLTEALAKKASKAKTMVTKPIRPSTAEMVNTAIEKLAERNGSSLQAIKKYLVAHYKLNMDRHSHFIKRYLKSAVTSATLVQTKGKGAAGSFKLAAKKPRASKSTPKVSKEEPAKKTPVKKTAKKTAAPKAKSASPKKAPAKKSTPAKSVKAKAEKPKPKSPSKVKKTIKGPTAKAKVPKPKKTTTTAKARSPSKKPAQKK
ncbi:histone H1E-like [Diachasmimorpha longicaudata]|uniref:histone H1E-like n=1 Tax=Diachasmimorpha longicaudata TaxID=58733 RepID=UPI0030B8A184